MKNIFLLLGPLLPLGTMLLAVRGPQVSSWARLLGMGAPSAYWVWGGVGAGGVLTALGAFGAGAASAREWAAVMLWGAASYCVARWARGSLNLQRETLHQLAGLKTRVETLEGEERAFRGTVERLEQQDARAFYIYTLAKSLTESVSWDQFMNRLPQVLQKATGASDFFLYFVTPGGDLEVKWRHGVWPAVPPAGAGGERRPHWVEAGSDRLLRVPLWREGELLGVLWMRWAKGAPSSLDGQDDLFEPLVVGFQKARLFARVEALSRHDGLTGVFRRDVLLEAIEREDKRARAFGTTYSFLLIDVDHFKKINDAHGHPAGDAVLSRLGALLRAAVYETDTVGRYGGEEFGVLLSRAEPVGALRKADILRERVAQEPFDIGLTKVAVTVSIGVAHYPLNGATSAQVMAAADKALYKAKDAGRNRAISLSS